MNIVVVNRKHICIFLVAIFVICIMGFTYSNFEVIGVNATPITNKRIIIDAGHGLPDEGDCLLKSSKVPYIQYLN